MGNITTWGYNHAQGQKPARTGKEQSSFFLKECRIVINAEHVAFLLYTRLQAGISKDK